MMNSLRSRGTVAMRALAVAPLLALSLAACGSSDTGGSAGAKGTSSPRASSTVSAADYNVRYASCMRGKGVDMPDPVDGQVMSRNEAQMGAAEKAADAACTKELGPAPAGQGGTGGGGSQTTDATLLKVFACLREKGYDVKDPKAGDTTFDADVPPAAMEACGLTMAGGQ